MSTFEEAHPPHEAAVPHRLSEQIDALFANASGETLRFGDLLRGIEAKSYGFLIVLLSLPVALPATPPGFSVPFGVLLILLAVQLAFNRPQPWFPKFIVERPIKTKGSKFLRGAAKFVGRFEKMLKPRGGMFYRTRAGKLFIGVTIIATSIAFMTPFPITNSICSIGVMMIGLAMMEEDVVVGLLGAALAWVGTLIVVGLVIAVYVLGRNIVGS